ncbi:gluconate 2-dehydrogenase subunit 3 family protein [Prosthecobacter sp.]|uniref:gluconate 2-dehydrogenase subunit 3 family protein n=1 Tax=Prosthecobacter sp. TaxID=1965333 RepID=UPI003783241D
MSTPLDDLPRMDRRKALQWMLTATATMAIRDPQLFAADAAPVKAQGYGPDPVMVKVYKPGDVWPLTLTEPQRRTTRALCDVILPADDTSPSASALGVPDFIDEWISSPYPAQAGDRRVILEGLKWIDAEANTRFSKAFADLPLDQQTALCTDLAAPKPQPALKQPAAFFKRFRDLTAGGYYTTPEGMKAIGYVGNMPSGSFEGPPLEALQHVGLA